MLVATVTCAAALLIAFLGDRTDAKLVPPEASADVKGSLHCDSISFHNKVFIINNKGFQCMPNRENLAADKDMTFTVCFVYINDMSALFLTDDQLEGIRAHMVFENVVVPIGGLPLYEVCNNVLNLMKSDANKDKIFEEVFEAADITALTWEDFEATYRVYVYYQRNRNGMQTSQRAGKTGEIQSEELPEGTTCEGRKTHFLDGHLVYECDTTGNASAHPGFVGCAYGNVSREAQNITYLEMEISEDNKTCALHDYCAYVDVENDPTVLTQFSFQRAVGAAGNKGPAICEKLSEAYQPIGEYNNLTHNYKLAEKSVTMSSVEPLYFPNE